jgi:hypothetical protein
MVTCARRAVADAPIGALSEGDGLVRVGGLNQPKSAAAAMNVPNNAATADNQAGAPRSHSERLERLLRREDEADPGTRPRVQIGSLARNATPSQVLHHLRTGSVHNLAMRVAWRDRYGGPDVVSVREIDKPEPGPGEVLVRVKAASVNRADLDGLYPRWGFIKLFLGLRAPKPTYRRLGVDMAGTVEAVGEASPGSSPATTYSAISRP